MDDDVGYELNGDARSICNVDIDPTPINGLEAVHYELLLQCDHHVTLEHNPQRLVLDDSVAEGPGSRVDRVVIARVVHDVVLAIAAAHSIAPKPNAAVG